MTFYLFQSVVFVAVFSPFALGLQDRMGRSASLGVGFLTWSASVVIADLMRRLVGPTRPRSRTTAPITP